MKQRSAGRWILTSIAALTAVGGFLPTRTGRTCSTPTGPRTPGSTTL
jgi:hypothetical protein